MEHLITVKDLLAVVSRRNEKKCSYDNNANPLNSQTQSNIEETHPAWLPTTYCLKRELPAFISYFQQRDKLYVLLT